MQPTIKQIQARAVLAPFRLTPRSASGELSHAALVLIDIKTSTKAIGRAYLFAISPAMLTPLVETIKALAPGVAGEPLAPSSINEKLRNQLRLLDTPGLVGLALSGIDMALWDAHSQHAGLPLASMLGSSEETVPAYNSCGLWIQSPETVADEAQELLETHNFKALKMRIGRTDANADLDAARRVKERIGPDVYLMSDFNQSQSVASAIYRSRMLDEEGLYWIEEPIRHADYSGCAQVRNAINTPIQIGENLCSDFDLKSAIDARAAQYYMPDVQRIGGVTGWIRAAALCNAHGLEISSHLFPEISVHLLAASPTQHWLEYVDWANPILKNPLEINNGHAVVPQRPGSGIEWNEKAVKKFLV